MNRVSKHNYYLDIAETVAERGTCLRRNYGAIIVKNDEIISTGYNGAPRGRKNCTDLGYCMREKLNIPRGERYELCRSVHAEQNAICQAARRGIALEGATLYCRMTPCRTCAMLIINCGIRRVVCERKYHNGKDSEDMFAQAGIEIEFFHDEIEKYENQ